MFFFLSTAEYTISHANALRVRVSLTNGFAEILDLHQDLLGKIDTDYLEVETLKENGTEKSIYLLQSGVFVVSTKGLNIQKKETTIYVYARRAKDISKENVSLTLEAATKEYKEKKIALEKEQANFTEFLESQKEGDKGTSKRTTNSKITLLEQDVQFLERVISTATNWKYS